MPKVSIIIPIYNVEKYLDKCVQSVKKQTLQDIEIILVDDESPDNCPQICDDYEKQDSRIKVVHKKNGGLGFARNSGLEIATGEYVTFLDSDDFVDVFTYEHLYNLIKLYNLDALYYKFIRFSDENNVLIKEPVNEIVEYKDNAIKDLMLDIIASEPTAKVERKVQCSSCTAIYKLEIIRNNNVYFHSERELISEDMVFNLDFLKYSQKVGYNDGEHYHYRVNPTSLTSTVRIDRIDKHAQLYHYITEKLSYWELDINNGRLRAKRLFIGCSRSSICQIMLSRKLNKQKKMIFKELVTNKIWREVAHDYPINSLPLYQKMFYYGCLTNNYYLVKSLCLIKKLLS